MNTVIRLVALSLLFSGLSGVARADCSNIKSVSATLASNVSAVAFNPFEDSGPGELTLRVTFDDRCDADRLKARLFFPLSDGSVSGFPGLAVRTGSSEDGRLVYQSLAAYSGPDGDSQAFDLDFASNNPEPVASARLQVQPLSVAARSTAPSGQSQSHDLSIDLVVQENGQDVGDKASFSIPVQTITQRKISLASSFSGTASPHSQDFGELTRDSGAKTQTTRLYLWNNGGNTTLSATSDTWTLTREENEGSTSSLHNIPFTLSLVDGSGSSDQDLLGALSDNTRTTDTLRNSAVEGDLYEVRVTVGEGAAIGRRAGKYTGSVTITVSPNT